MLLSSLNQSRIRVEVVSGAPAILQQLPGLRESAESWGQSDELAELPFLLSVPAWPGRRALLVLLYTEGEHPETGQLAGAVLLFAHGPRFFGNRLLSQGDRLGRRCVFAPPAERTSVAVTVARALLERGAALVALPYRVDNDAAERDREASYTSAASQQEALAALRMLGSDLSVQWTLRGIARRLHLPLERRFDDTLQRVGRRTRRNMRAALRLCERDLGTHLEWNPPLSFEELARINAASARPVRRAVLAWRHTTPARTSGAFLAALRSATGEWIAVAGGRRTGDTVTLDWQMNVRSFARFSVSLLMRGLLMERFGADGVTRMRFEGGTAHTLARAFHTGTVYVFRAQRRSIWLRALERCLRTFFPSRALTRALF